MGTFLTSPCIFRSLLPEIPDMVILAVTITMVCSYRLRPQRKFYRAVVGAKNICMDFGISQLFIQTF